ncbi:MAG: sulfatase-like hydrolase/transferase [Marmoricola sp.]
MAEEDITDKPMWMQIWLPNTPYENAAMTEVERQRAVSIYAWDVQFGRIVRALRKAGATTNTVFIFTSDNGYYLGEHRQPQGKINGHEPSIRVPGDRWPGGRTRHHLRARLDNRPPQHHPRDRWRPSSWRHRRSQPAPRVGRPQSRLGAAQS